MRELVLKYAADPDDPKVNFDLAYEYHSLGHVASAQSHYLRCAERTDDDDLAYEALLRSYYCYAVQGNRDITAFSYLQQAQSFIPTRPEAYYLIAVHQAARQAWAECYNTCTLAMTCCDFNSKPLMTYMGYKGVWNILKVKSEASWHWEKNQECRDLLREIVTIHWNDIEDEEFKKDVLKQYSLLGMSRDSQKYHRYKLGTDTFKYPFPGLDYIETNYSQVYQDMFVLYMTKGKDIQHQPTYLEIGAGDWDHNSNTKLLEDFGWKGVSVEMDYEKTMGFKSNRKNTILFADATELNYSSILEKHFDNAPVIDYLQLDIEPAKNTFSCLLSIPFDQCSFRVITYEHDYYIDPTKSFRDKSRKYLSMLGYKLVISDVSPDGLSTFEDWWVHPNLVDPELVQKIQHTTGTVNIKEYLTYEK